MIRRALLAALLLLISASSADAWWDAGHKIVAAIAYRQLSADEQLAVARMLTAHPRWHADFVDWMPETLADAELSAQAEWVFMQAALWPDLARDFEDDEKAKYHHATWHYINMPLYLNEGDRDALANRLTINVSTMSPREPKESMNIIQALQVARRKVDDPATPAADRAVLLTWLFHLVGDIHQPLHATTLCSQRLYPDGCRGGNAVPTRQRENLHSLWDSLLGERLSYRQARNEATKLMADPDHQAAGEHAARNLDVNVWLRESQTLAEEFGYNAEVLTPLRRAEQTGERPPVISLTEDYLKQAGQVAHRRVIEAGYRLAAVLRAVCRTDPAASRPSPAVRP